MAANSTIRIGLQLTVCMENAPGSLLRLTELFGDADINVYAISVLEGLNHGYIRVIADDPDRAATLLQDHGLLVLRHDVLLLDLPNEPGSLRTLTQRLAKAEINIEYLYCASGPEAKTGLVVAHVKDSEQALAELLK